MFDIKRMYVNVIFLLIYSVVVIFVVTRKYYSSQVNTYQEPRLAKFVQYRSPNSMVTAETQPTSHKTESGENFDYERIKKMYQKEACPIRKTSPYKSTNRTGLLSFPASGVTWTRHLIHQLTGFQTCSANQQFACVLYKRHSFGHTSMAPFGNAVIIIRNPLYSLKSYFHYLYGEQKNKPLFKRNKVEKHTGFANTSMFFSPKWTSHVKKYIPEWKRSYVSWFKLFKRNSMVIVYENLKQNVFRELLRLIRFLNIKVTPKDLWCTLVNQEGEYHRISRNLTETNVFTLFTEQQKREVLKAVCEVSKVARNMEIDLDISQYFATLSDTPNTACS